MEEEKGVYAERSLWSGTGWCARGMKKRTGSHMQVCQRDQTSIVLLFGFHSLHSSMEDQKGNQFNFQKERCVKI